jgi:hypothetical protein
MPTDTSGRSISDVLRSIVDNVQDIVRSELRLAQTEIGVELAKAKGAGVLLGVGLACGLFAVLFGLLGAVFGLGNVVPMWAASLIVAAPLGLAGACLYSAGRKRLRGVHAVPERAVETARESIEWAKQQIK